MTVRLKQAVLMGVCLWIGTVPAYADAELEHLAVISAELQHVLELIERSEEKHRAANENARIQFRYDALKRQVKMIQIGIARHIAWVEQNPKYERFVVE